MPSKVHEMPLELIRDQPELVTELLLAQRSLRSHEAPAPLQRVPQDRQVERPGAFRSYEAPAPLRGMRSSHRRQATAHDVLTAYAAAIDACDLDRGRRYHDFTQSQLSAAAQQMLEAIVPEQGYKWRSTFAIEHRCAGEATAVLEVLDARGIEVTPQQRDWITQCTDESTLRTWIRRAVTAETADEVFG